MAVDCFLCFAEYEGQLAQLRNAMCGVCLARWKQQPDIELRVLRGKGRDFQRERRIYADTHATTPVYLVADDDCLLADNPFYVQRVLNVMEAYPEFAILAAYPVNSILAPWRPCQEELDSICVGGKVYEDDLVQEHVSVGGIYATRKGAMKEWPNMEQGVNGYDSIQASYLRAHGYRVGFMREGFSLNHLGRNYSSTLA